jgi:hypothetical protein
VAGHIGEPATAAKIVETPLSRFKSIDVLVNNCNPDSGLLVMTPVLNPDP